MSVARYYMINIIFKYILVTYHIIYVAKKYANTFLPLESITASKLPHTHTNGNALSISRIDSSHGPKKI